ncbi:unnamed protein product [Hyaloperonospora brassicae]|uniref:Phosphatidylserine decarboxylase proenzyme, mitochondrial n=1 Tax=Hyaloperonospora brassicae TaxID=162125 RepID=A0AAV0UPF4_HYABA|nr:unnamed protein product [Hyaloperonospora brassicae]
MFGGRRITVELQSRHQCLMLRHQQQRLIAHFDRFASSTKGRRNVFAGSWKIPATLGFAFIGFLQWQQLTHPTDEERKAHPAAALLRLPGSQTSFEATMATERQLQSLKFFPYRAASRLWGAVHNKDLPMWLRAPVYKAWTAVFNCKLDEMRYPLQDYANLGEFFSRPLKDGIRPFDTSSGHLASPVDGMVSSVGRVDDSCDVPTLEQIKGARYRLDEFLGSLPAFFSKKTSVAEGTKLFYCVLYLAPGDYHRIHAPVDWQVKERRHFPGNLFPVNRTAARLIPSLFVENERVALLGEWEHGFFSLTAVGATNVGSIVLTKEPAFRTNTVAQDVQAGQCFVHDYSSKVKTARGEEMAQFKLGSTVVLVFEAPESFRFVIKPGEKLVLGRCIGKTA